MGKTYKKWWRFNDIPVEFVEPGIDPATARRKSGYRKDWGKRPKQRQLGFEEIIAIVSVVVLIIGGGWWFFLRDQPVKASESIPTATSVAFVSPTPTETVQRTPYIRVPAVTPTSTATMPPTPTPSAQVLESVIESPISSPSPKHVVVTATKTPTTTATRAPHAYEVIANYSQPEPIYSFISGWIVEMDGSTPRPVGIEVVYPTGSMQYPRPNNKDIANGHYEFMVSPGEYDIRVLDYDCPPVHISVGENTRYEVSFKHTRAGDNIVPVRSNPWSTQYAEPVSTPFSPIPTPAPVSVIYLPIVFK